MKRGSVHPDIVTVPAAWAVAEQTGADGKAFLAAVALGNEVACRFGAANLQNKGWFYTSVHGVFGAAAAAAKLLGLDAAGIASALGLALSRGGRHTASAAGEEPRQARAIRFCGGSRRLLRAACSCRD